MIGGAPDAGPASRSALGADPGSDFGSDPGSTPEITRQVTRGAARLFEDLGCAVVTEFTLANGRRADVAVLHGDGTLELVEVKSGLPDFRADGKWSEYLDFCDAFYFAVAPGFPMEVLPDAAVCGLLVADAWGAEIVRPAPARKLAPARRRAVTIRIARVAAQRLRLLTDPRL